MINTKNSVFYFPYTAELGDTDKDPYEELAGSRTALERISAMYLQQGYLRIHHRSSGGTLLSRQPGNYLSRHKIGRRPLDHAHITRHRRLAALAAVSGPVLAAPADFGQSNCREKYHHQLFQDSQLRIYGETGAGSHQNPSADDFGKRENHFGCQHN